MPFTRNTNTVSTSFDEQAFATVFRLHFESLYNYGIKISGKSDLVEDSIQEVFFRIWKNNIDVNTISNIKSYLFRALRRQLINMLELKASQTIQLDITDIREIEFSPEDFIIVNQTEEENRRNILRALNSLPYRQREAIYLRFYENLSFAEIANVMNINAQSAKNSVFRGLETMKKLFPFLVIIELLTQ